MRIVLDTNCLLQILGAKSPYHFLFSDFLHSRYDLCVSTEILFEYEEILRLKASVVAADLFMKVISRSRNVFRKDPYFHLDLMTRDQDDNKFVDCAFACQADYIVTDDRHFDEVASIEFPQFNIINLDAFSSMMKRIHHQH